jgi:hypothetical protein
MQGRTEAVLAEFQEEPLSKFRLLGLTPVHRAQVREA